MGFEAYTQDADIAPLFKGLPDDDCQCEHIGYVYVGPGHTPVLYAGIEVVEFSPTETLNQTLEVVAKNMPDMESASA